jgi:CHASE2 domain-containing sensor protein
MQFGNSNESVPVCPGETRNWAQPVEACVDEDQDEINLRDAAGQVVKRIPANYNFINNLGMVSKVDIAEPSQLEGITETIKYAYSDSQVLRKPNTYKGAIVVIGVRRSGECPGPANPDVVCVSDSEGEPRKGKRYGMEVQANIISNLMTCTYIRPTSIGWDLFLILLMVGLGVLLQLKERKWLPFRIPVKIPFTEKKIVIPWLLIAAPIAYFLIAFVVYKEWRILPGNAAYQFLALVTSYLTFKITRKRLGSS